MTPLEYQQKKAEQDKLRAERKREDRKFYNIVHAEDRREHRIKTIHGITQEQYDEMFKAQDGKCAICGTTKLKKGCNHLHIDHNHVTGVIRGLLCDRCNRGLGYFDDNSELLRKAIAYLEGEKC